MKIQKYAFAALLMMLSGCNRGGTPGNNTVSGRPQPSPLPTRSMPSRIGLLFPGAGLQKIEPALSPAAEAKLKKAGLKLDGSEKKWEFYEAKRNGGAAGKAAVVLVKGADGRAVQIVVVLTKQNKILHLAAGTPGTSGVTKGAASLQPFLQKMVGYGPDSYFSVGPALETVPGVPRAVAQEAAFAVQRALILLTSG